MRLDAKDLEVLRKPFTPDDTEFLGKFAYIKEHAVTTRIEDVDPEWTFEVLAMSTRDNQVIVTARLTIKGVSRDGVGMAVILDKGVGEPEKSAATDALKRCARLFGIGRYLLELSGVNNEESLRRWFNTINTPTNVQQLNPQPQPRRVDTGEPDILPTTPTTQSANVVKVSVKRTGQGESKILTLQLDNKLYLKLRTRQAFILAGWVGGAMWTADGEYPLEKPIPITIKRDATGKGWDLDTVEPAPNAFMQRGDDLPAASGQ